MTADQANHALAALQRVEGTGLARNQAVHEYLSYGMPLPVATAQGTDTRIVRFFDFDHPVGGRNEFVVTTQLRIKRSKGSVPVRIIPDIVLFVNGIPLVVMEAKAPTLFEGWKCQAVRQLHRYQEAGPEFRGAGAPQLFHYNLLSVAHCGAGAVYGALGAPDDRYVGWKSSRSDEEFVKRFGVEPHGQHPLVAELLSPATLLEVLRDFVIFEPEQGRTVKKLPRYQQYRAVRRAVERLATGGPAAERGGVVWHTQGSGKSLTMFWLATKLRRDPRLRNPAIIVVTDRRQLDRQIAATFQRCGFPVPERATSRRALRDLLAAGPGRTGFTTIQKFEELPEAGLHALNPSADVVVMVDEAHRTQYGIFAARLSQALPNAALIGFTGTPIDKGFRHSTMRRFGRLIDAYPIPDAVADGFTVEIRYQARLPELAIEGPNTLDRLFDALFGDEPENTREQIRRRYANKETIAQADKRIQMIALDIADHFSKAIRPNGFKAQVVVPTRRAALRYAKHLRDFGLSAYPIITTTAGDGPEFEAARELDQKQITAAFVDPAGEPKALVVVDMLLTGFDAPVEQVLYLDKGLREHGLLQAIARVNRRFSHRWNGVDTTKGHGLIVDYHGVSQDLNAALGGFDRPDVEPAMLSEEADPGAVIEAAAVRAESHFGDSDLDDTWGCVLVFEGGRDTEDDFRADAFDRFRHDYRAFARLMDRFLPDPKALPYVDRLARLTKIHAFVRAHFLGDDTSVNWAEVGAKVKRLLDQRIGTEVKHLMKPVSILARNFEETITALPHDRARAAVMEHALRREIHARIEDDPPRFEKLSERLQRIIRELHDQVIDSAEAGRRLADLRAEIVDRENPADRHGLAPLTFEIYQRLHHRREDGAKEAAMDPAPYAGLDPEVRATAREVERVARSHIEIVDWESNADVQRQIRRDIKRVLVGNRYALDDLDALVRNIVRGIARAAQR